MKKESKEIILKLNDVFKLKDKEEDILNITSYSESFAGYNFFKGNELIKYIRYSEVDNNKKLNKYLRDNYNECIYEKKSKKIIILIFLVYFMLIMNLFIILLKTINNINFFDIYYFLFITLILIGNILIFIKNIKITFIEFSLIDDKLKIKTLFNNVITDMKNINIIEYKHIKYSGYSSIYHVKIHYNNNKNIEIELNNYKNISFLKTNCIKYNIKFKKLK